MHFIQSQFICYCLCCCLTVSGQHNAFLHAYLLHAMDSFFYAFLNGIGNYNGSGKCSIYCNINYGSGTAVFGIGNIPGCHHFGISKPYFFSIYKCMNSMSGNFFCSGYPVHIQFFAIGFTHGISNRMIGISFYMGCKL